MALALSVNHAPLLRAPARGQRVRCSAARRNASPETELAELTAAVEALRCDAVRAQAEYRAEIDACHVSMRESARNLAAYLGVRRLDLRELQLRLYAVGLSALGNVESGVLENLDAVLRALACLRGEGPLSHTARRANGTRLLRLRTHASLGRSQGASTRCIVTLPPEAATRAALVESYLRSGMCIARINTAHDSPEVWARMVDNVRLAAASLGRPCKVQFDLQGPKLRVGAMQPGPPVLKLRPRRDELGRISSLASAILFREGDPHSQATATAAAEARRLSGPCFLVPLAQPGATALLSLASVGGALVLKGGDARGAKAKLSVLSTPAEAGAARSSGFLVAACSRTVYLTAGSTFTLSSNRADAALEAEVGELPRQETALRLRVGDLIHLRLGDGEARPVPGGAEVWLSVPLVFRRLQVGHRVLFDDGRLEGAVVECAAESEIVVKLTRCASPPGATTRLRSGKGINFPDTDFTDDAGGGMEEADREALASILPLRPDLLALSFVQSAAAVAAAQDALRDAPGCSLVLKIETAAGFRALPALLFAAMKRPGVAVMLARGDLGPELGWARLSEVTEQTGSLCEAGHLPLIWATQVLETLTRTGIPSRAEVADASLGSRAAEAFLLNKGPFVADALHLLADISRRMSAHGYKHRNLLRRLRIASTDGISESD